MRTILFDFDGTIADTLPIIFHSFRTTFLHFLQEHYENDDIIRLFGPPEIPILQKQIPVHLHDDAIRYFYQVYEQMHAAYPTDPRIADMLRSFHDAGIQMGIVTGKGRGSADISIRLLGLEPFFPIVITGDEMQNYKPHPEGILRAMAYFQADPRKTMYVGDSDADIVAARAANITSIGVNWLSVSQKTGGFTPQPDHTFTDPSSFTKWVLQM